MALFLLITYIVIFTFQIILFVITIRKKKTLANIVFGRTNSAAYIHRTDDLL